MCTSNGLQVPQPTGRPRRVWLGILVLAWGIQAIVTQSLLLREALVLMFGSEFAWGIVLSAWLCGVAVGGTIGGYAAQRLRRADVTLVVILLVLSLAAGVELWVFRGARAWLGIAPGELLPLPKTALAAVLLVSPIGALVGMAFPLACCITPSEPRVEWNPDLSGARADYPCGPRPAVRNVLQLGNVYALESAGSLIGGAAFSFWAVEHLNPLQTVLICGVITAAASAGLLFATTRRPYAPVCLAMLATWTLVLAVLAGEGLNRRLIDRRWQNVAPGYERCTEVESKYQNLAIGRRAEQFTLYCDGQVTADFPDPYTFVPLAHFWMCQHPRPRTVLVLGGGAEGLLAEILRHPVQHVDYVESDPRLIELLEPYLTAADRRALADERVVVHHVDARYFIKTQADRFDLVIARLPEPTSALRARLYTDEFYRELVRAMTPRSVLCLTVAATPGSLSPASREYLGSIRAALRRHFPDVTVGWGHPAHVLAATEPHLVSTDPGELARRYAQRGIQSGLFDPAWFEGATDWLDPAKLQQRAAELDAADHLDISTDLRPVVYVQRLVLWERMTGGREVGMLERLRSVGWPGLVVTLAAIAGATLLACYVRARWGSPRASAPADPRARPPWLSSSAIILSVGTSGFATMALSMIWLFAFQNLYGYVYQRIGWIIAVFMGGLVIGCGLVSRRSKRWAAKEKVPVPLWRWLITVDVLLAVLALAVPFILPALGRLQSGPLSFIVVEWCVSVMVVLTGVLGGAAFALAGGLQFEATGRAGVAAGTIVGADHAGACLGALLSGLLLVPVFGTVACAVLLAGVKLGSAVLLLAARRPGISPDGRRPL